MCKLIWHKVPQSVHIQNQGGRTLEKELINNPLTRCDLPIWHHLVECPLIAHNGQSCLINRMMIFGSTWSASSNSLTSALGRIVALFKLEPYDGFGPIVTFLVESWMPNKSVEPKNKCKKSWQLAIFSYMAVLTSWWTHCLKSVD